MRQIGFAAGRAPLARPPRSHPRPSPLPPRCYSESDAESCDFSQPDCFSVSLRLAVARLDLSRAVAADDFPRAAALRDTVLSLERDHRALALARYRPPGCSPAFSVGTVIRHVKYRYRGVIVGYDPQCLAPESWQRHMRVDLLPGGASQPFYHVLVDCRDRPGGQTTYVAQENVVPSRRPLEVQHPLVERYLQVLKDADGRGGWAYLPRAELRELYRDDF